MLKNCIDCNKRLDVKNFDKYKKGEKYYFKSRCKPCHRIKSYKYLKLFKEKNPEYMKNYMKDWEIKNSKERQKYRKKRWEENKELLTDQWKDWYKKNKEKRIKYNEVYFETNRDKLLIKARVRANKRRQDPLLSKKDYIKVLKSRKIQRSTGHPRAIWERLRQRIITWNKRQRIKSEGYLMKHISCSKIFLKCYLELQFYKNKKTGVYMSWENYPLWHIDHIVPLSKCAKLKKEKRKYANHFLNLRPLWPEENLKKGARLEGGLNIDDIIKKSKLLPKIKFDLFRHKSCLSNSNMNGKNPNLKKNRESPDNARKLAQMVRLELF